MRYVMRARISAVLYSLLMACFFVQHTATTYKDKDKVDGPKFFLLGAAKSATTSLADLLTSHREICSAYEPETNWHKPVKEVDFLRKRKEDEAPEIYQSFFRGCTKKNFVGYIDSTPMLHASEKAVFNMLTVLKTLNGKRVIIVLREPVAREYSRYLMFFDKCLRFFKENKDSGASFDTTCNLDNMPDNRRFCYRYCNNKNARQANTIEELRHEFNTFRAPFDNDQYSATTGSLYYREIQDFLKVFKRNQLFIISMDYLIHNTTDVTKRLAQFMGLSSDWGNNVELPRDNVQRHYEAFSLECDTLHFLRHHYKAENEKLYRFMKQGGGPPSEPPFSTFADPMKTLACER